MATFGEQSDLVVDIVTDRAGDAQSWLSTTETMVNAVRDAITAAITDLGSLGVTFSLNGVDTTYVPSSVAAPTIPTEITGLDTTYIPPTQVAPTIPSPAAVAIGDEEWDRIFNRAAAQEARAGVAEEYNAQSEGMLRGVAIPAIITNAMVGLAQQRTMDRISSVAETSAIEQAKAAREDAIALAKLELDKFTQIWSTQTQSENVRKLFEDLKTVGVVDLATLQANMYKVEVESKAQSEQTRLEYEKLEMEKVMQPEKFRAEYALKQMELITSNSVGQLVDLVQVYAQLVNSLISGSAVDLGSRVSMSLGQQVYNPTQGEVIQYPA